MYVYTYVRTLVPVFISESKASKPWTMEASRSLVDGRRASEPDDDMSFIYYPQLFDLNRNKTAFVFAPDRNGSCGDRQNARGGVSKFVAFEWIIRQSK